MGRDFRSFITLTAGAFFGEIALLFQNQVRPACEASTVTISTRSKRRRSSGFGRSSPGSPPTSAKRGNGGSSPVARRASKCFFKTITRWRVVLVCQHTFRRLNHWLAVSPNSGRLAGSKLIP